MSSVRPQSPAPCHICTHRPQPVQAGTAGLCCKPGGKAEQGREEESRRAKLNHLHRRHIPDRGRSRSGESCSSTPQPRSEKSRSPNLSLFYFPQVFSRDDRGESREGGRLRTTSFFRGSFSPSSAPLATEKPAKQIPQPLPPRTRQKYRFFHTYSTAQNRNLAHKGGSDPFLVHLKPQSGRWSSMLNFELF